MYDESIQSVVACWIILSTPVPFHFLWTLDFVLGTWILDLDFGLGFWTGIGLDNKIIIKSCTSLTSFPERLMP